MGIKQDIKESLEKFDISKIDGQPIDEDMNQLTRELLAMLATAPTTNGGGDHGHIGMILKDMEYTSFSTGATPFVVPKNPGPFSSTISTNEVDHLHQLPNTNNSSLSTRPTKDAYRPQELKSSKPLTTNGLQASTVNSLASCTALWLSCLLILAQMALP